MALPNKLPAFKDYHWHHIVPKHAGGTDDPSNLVLLSPLAHAYAHLIRYEELGDTKDLAAAKILMGSLRDNGMPVDMTGIKRPDMEGNTFAKGNIPWNKGKTYTQTVRPTKERGKRISKALTGRKLSADHLATMRKQRNGTYRWMTNGVVDKRILKADVATKEADGWHIGRTTGIPKTKPA